jgi:hypothetical protein
LPGFITFFPLAFPAIGIASRNFIAPGMLF